MKKRGKLLSIILSAIAIVCALPTTAFATNTETINEIISAQVSEKEISEIDAILLEQEGGGLVESSGNPNVYKVYWLPTLMVTTYRDNPTLESLLTDEYVFETDVSSMLSKDSVARLSVKDGKIQFSGVFEKTDSYISNEKIARAIEESDVAISEINEIKITNSAMYHSYFVFVITDSNNYVIPFPAREEFLGVEAGKLYTVDELMNTMYEIFDEEKLSENPDSVGGVPLRDSSIDSNTDIVIVLAIVVSVSVIITALVLIKKKKLVQ